jgi:uncharacterized protein
MSSMDDKDHRLLLNLARESIRTAFASKKPDLTHVKKYDNKQGVFVSLYDRRGKLRGCIGYPSPTHALYIGIVEAARNAAFRDSRFVPLKEEELNDIRIEISVLSRPQLIEVSHYNDFVKKIEIGKDGLVVENPYGAGLLLPQVALENNFNVQSFLNCASQKAGLSFNAWKEKNTKVYKFQAEVFSE